MSLNTTIDAAGTIDTGLVRASRDGDQFHYHWAARHCLSLLPGVSDLVAISIEGASTIEGPELKEEGDELIDVGFYYGSETLKEASLVRYVQLKHSTRLAQKPWTASGLAKTLRGFSKRFKQLYQTFPWDELKDKVDFIFTTNRPIDNKVIETLEDLAEGKVIRYPAIANTLSSYVSLEANERENFFKLFSVEGGEPDLWNQRNLLFDDVRTYLGDIDSEAALQLKELVTRKATSEHETNPSIRRIDVLRALGATEKDLWPVENLIASVTEETFAREQEREILTTLELATSPVVLYAEGGVGKTTLACQLSRSIPQGSVAVLYDCFGNGMYRNTQFFRHRQKDAFPQIANELAAQGLCYPLIPVRGMDCKQYMRELVARLKQAITSLRAKTPSANLYLIIDAADNAVIAAREFNNVAFVPELISSVMPDGVKLLFSCRTHRRDYLQAPPDAVYVELKAFSQAETTRHLKRFYPEATRSEVLDFHSLTNSNPRVQALALSKEQPLVDMLRALGPSPTTVEMAISELLSKAVEELKFREGQVEAEQISLICQGLAVLRPLVPIRVLAEISGTTESAVRSFAYDLGRPLLVKGDSLHFLDEPSETWFRENYQPDREKLTIFLERLRPLAASSSYVASTIPQLLWAAGRMDELVELALSSEGLPTESPLERRDVEVQRLSFALKACLQDKHYTSAAKLALKVAGELAGVERQNDLIQGNTDIASALLSPDRIGELVSRRAFKGNWMGGHHAYEAGLLAGREELVAEARSRLRMAIDWLRSWARMSHEERKSKQEQVNVSDIAELAMVKLLTEGPKDTVKFLSGWTPRSLSMDIGCYLARRLVDLGRYDFLDQLAEHGARDIWLMLGLASEAYEGGHFLPVKPMETLMRVLSYRRVYLYKSDKQVTQYDVLSCVTASVIQALRVLPRDDTAWANVIRRYLPECPPIEFAERYTSYRIAPLRAYALEATLRNKQLTLIDLAPKRVREKLEQQSNHYVGSSEVEAFNIATGGVLAWFILSAKIACDGSLPEFDVAIQTALTTTSSINSRDYNSIFNLEKIATLEWIRAIRDASMSDVTALAEFKRWFDEKASRLTPETMTAICRIAARSSHAALKTFALEVSVKAYETIEQNREHAETKVDSYQSLARAIFPVSKAEASTYFERAVEISSHIGHENINRWDALLCLANARGKNSTPRPELAYRLARGAELTYKYVYRDSHFDWEQTIEGLLSLCPASAIATLSRWRDRDFGDADTLLKITIDRLISLHLLPPFASIALSPIGNEWMRVQDLEKALEHELAQDIRRKIFSVGYRYIRVSSPSERELERISQLANSCGFEALDLHRLLALAQHEACKANNSVKKYLPEKREKSNKPDCSSLLNEVDLTKPVALRTLYLQLKRLNNTYGIDDFYREVTNRCGLGRAAEFCRVVAQWSDFGSYQLKQLLNELINQRIKPIALCKAMREMVLEVCRRSPERVRRRECYGLFPYQEAINNGIVSDEQIMAATLEGYLSKVNTLNAGEHFQMLESLSSYLTCEEAGEALEFGLSLLETDLRSDDGDGLWSESMKPKGGCDEALAGYLWATLGSPSASVRWEAVHAVRATIELGWVSVLSALAKVATLKAPDFFVDKRFVFYEWHSRLWLNIALARCITEHREMVRLFGGFLLASVKEEHVLLRYFAGCALREIPELLEDSISLNILEKINIGELPLIEYTSFRELQVRTETSKESTYEKINEFIFGLDIESYWFTPLGRVFGISSSEVTREVIQVINEHMEGLNPEYDRDARYKNNVYEHEQTIHSHGSMPRVENLQAYLAYHAMMILAAKLLKTHSVGKATGQSKSDFEMWIEDKLLTRKDGRWLADRRDPQLTKAPSKPEGEDWRWQITAEYLDSLMETDEGSRVVAGDWISSFNEYYESVSVTSALVPKASAAAFLCAAQTSPDVNGYFFRLYEEQITLDENTESHDNPIESASRRLQSDLFKLRRWKSESISSDGIDEYDPWGERVCVSGDEPSAAIISMMDLSPINDGRRWVTKRGGLLRSEVWTQLNGYGRNKETVSGTRLSADKVFLKELLAVNPKYHLAVVLSLHRRVLRSSSDNDEHSLYVPPYVRYYLIDENGITRTLKSSN